MRKRILALTLPLLTLALPVSAHFNLLMPPSIAQSTEGGKGPPPCGPDTSSNGPVTPATGGQPLKLDILEGVQAGHPGFYRFALALKAVSEFPIDAVVKDASGKVLPVLGPGMSATAAYETMPVFPIIADHMFVHTNAIMQSFPSTAVPGEVMLPNLNCDKCILQVDEFMGGGHGSNGAAGYMYHHCAYLKITADPGKPIFDPNAASGGAGGVAGVSGAGGTTASGGAAVGGSSGAAESGGADGVPAASAGSAGVTAAGGAPAGGAPAGGAPASGVSAAGASAAVAGASTGTGGAGTVTEPASNDPSSGCSINSRSSDARPALAGLLGVLLLGRRRRRSRAVESQSQVQR